MHDADPSDTSLDTGGAAADGTRPAWPMWLLDAWLAVAVFGVPFLLGGRSAWGQLVLSVAAAGAALTWIILRVAGRVDRYRWTWAEPVLAAGCGLVLLQIVPLPSSLLEMISPALTDRLPAWSGAQFGGWSTLSLAPAATRSALIMIVAGAVLFLVTAQRIRTLADVERMLRWVAVASVVMAVFGLLQYLATGGQAFSFYELPYKQLALRVKGAFTNKNHFAQFLALGLGPLCWWLVSTVSAGHQSSRSFGPARRRAAMTEYLVWGLVFALAAVVFAGLLALSRGGAVALAVAGMVVTGLLFAAGQISARLVAGLGGTAVLVVALLAINGFADVSERLDNWNPGARLALWQANLDAARDFPAVGTGIGSHAEVYPMYLDSPFQEKEFTHAESSPLQVISEAGITGLVLSLLAVGCFGWWTLRGFRAGRSDPRIASATAAIAAALAAHLVHAGVDFIWYVPGCMVIVVVLAACAFGLSRSRPAALAVASRGRGELLLRLGWSIGGLVLVAVAGWAVVHTWPRVQAAPHWNDYLRITFREAPSDSGMTLEDWYRRRGQALQRTVTADPDHARAHIRLAGTCLDWFEIRHRRGTNPGMPLVQIRDVTWGPGFESREAVDEWLNTPGVLGPDRRFLDRAITHSRLGLEHCPLQGLGYLYLAELGFTAGENVEQRDAWIRQALVVRPRNAQVHFLAGREAWSAEHFETAIDHWRRSFHQDRVFQQRIIAILFGHMPPALLIDKFQPDWEALKYLKQLYQEQSTPEDFKVVLAHYADVARDRAGTLDAKEATTSWLNAAGAYRRLERQQEAETCYKAALDLSPSSFVARLGFCRWLFERGRDTEARKHLAWCIEQRPDDRQVKQLERQVRQANRPQPVSRVR